LDIGFKVLKLDSSNIKSWDSDFENLTTSLLDSIENIKSDRNEEDLVYEILLKYGLDLSLPIEELNINGKKIFSIGFGSLVCCLDNDIDTNIVEKIAELKKQFETDFGLENMRVVFKDSSFKDSVVKTNALQILKQNGINEVVSV
jgi:adenine-specific DNA-methyltransferase